MKKFIAAIALVTSLGLAACNDPAPVNNTPPAEPVIVDDECPRADGEPCR